MGLPAKAHNELARPAGMVQGEAVSPKKQHLEQLGLGKMDVETVPATLGGTTAASSIMGSGLSMGWGGVRGVGAGGWEGWELFMLLVNLCRRLCTATC
jgi:hypothetical protein